MKRPALGALEAACRDHGLRVTRQRLAILDVLARRSDHPTADEVYEKARATLPELSRTTVYRVLDTLVATGVARTVCHPGVAVRYEAALERHHHLVCVHCNRLFDLVSPRLEGIRLPSTRKLGFRVEDYTIHIHGTCSRCRRKAKVTRR